MLEILYTYCFFSLYIFKQKQGALISAICLSNVAVGLRISVPSAPVNEQIEP
jgi:hypothetical protein